MVNFELDEDQRLIRDTVVSFARTRFVRTPAKPTRKVSHHQACFKRVGSSGSFRGHSEEYGGLATPISDHRGRRSEELAYGDLSIAMHLLAPDS